MGIGSKKWLRPLKAREYCEHLFPSLNGAEYGLYHAVVEGRVRARYRGKVFDTEVAHALKFRWGEEPYDLPPDIELSVDDIDSEFEKGISKVRAPEVVATDASIPRWLVNRIGGAEGHGNGNRKIEGHHPPGQPQQPRVSTRWTRERASRAIHALYSNDVPDQSTVPNATLCRAVGKWLKEQKLPDVSDATILRAAGRRK